MRCATPAPPRTTRATVRFGSSSSPPVTSLAAALVRALELEPACRSAGKLSLSCRANRSPRLEGRGRRTFHVRKPRIARLPDIRWAFANRAILCRQQEESLGPSACCAHHLEDDPAATSAVPDARNLAFRREIEMLPIVPPDVGSATPSIAGMRRSGERPRGVVARAAVHRPAALHAAPAPRRRPILAHYAVSYDRVAWLLQRGARLNR